MSARKATTGRERLEQAFASAVRVDALVDIASLAATDAFDHPDGPAEDLIDDMLEIQYSVHPSAEVLRKVVTQADDEGALGLVGESFIQAGTLGLAVRFVTPVMHKVGKSSSLACSWGYTQSTWIYAETYDKAWEMGVAWAEKCREDAMSAKPARRRGAGRKQGAGSAA